MSGLSRGDLSVIEGDARISDRRLMEVLGLARIDVLHRLIKDNWDELSDFGEVFHRLVENSRKGGRPSHHYYLNHHQAVTLCILARTEKARAARRQVVEVFMAYERGDLYALAQMKQQAPDPFAVQAERSELVARQGEANRRVDARSVTHWPLWKSGRRPKGFENVAMRQFLTDAHRQMTLKQARDEAARRFGDAAPSMSSIQRYWARLDKALGPHGPVRMEIPS